MLSPQVDGIWSGTFPERVRPKAFTSTKLDEDGFRPLADPLEFVADLSKLSTAELYVLAANNQTALAQAQSEFFELEKTINHIKSKDPTAVPSTKDPQRLTAAAEFDERKESVLYGYKYDGNRPLAAPGRWPEVTEIERRDLRSYQDAFAQGGFVPNDRQFKGLMNRAKDKRNPDNWKPIERNGKRLIPRMAPRVNEKDEYALLSGFSVLVKSIGSKPVTRAGTPDVEENGGRGTPVNKRLRNTRFNGAKVPMTRDVSEAPSLPVSRASTPKRKRGDTPLVQGLQGELNGSPIKKPRTIAITAPETTAQSKRKHHNQYTKAREKAVLEVDTAAGGSTERSDESLDKAVSKSASEGSIPTQNRRHRPWSGLSTEELRAYHWNNDTLKQAVADDYTWLTDDLSLSAEWRDKILASTYPVRTHSMFKKWKEWRENGEDKRPRNRNKLHPNAEGVILEAASGAVTTPSSPLSRNILPNNISTDGALDNESPAVNSMSNQLAQNFSSSQIHSERETKPQNGRASTHSSSSGTPSQTISVHQDLPNSNPARRTTRAARKASI